MFVDANLNPKFYVRRSEFEFKVFMFVEGNLNSKSYVRRRVLKFKVLPS